MTDYSRAFGAKADVYAQHRWDYAPQAIDQLCALARLGPGAAVADVGAGTGILCAHFLRLGFRVAAVEPNAEMRALSEQQLGHDANFCALEGYAHATGLAEESVELVAVGRALHWFDAEPARAEFLRILKPGGWLAVLQTPTTDPYLADAMNRLRQPETGWKTERSKHNLAQTSLGYYFGTEAYQTLAVTSSVVETWPQFFGRVSSLSPAPNPGDPLYNVFEATARDIFERGAVNGLLHVACSTTVAMHQIKASGTSHRSSAVVQPLPFEAGEIERSIGERYEKVVARFPERAALRAAGDEWSYRRLNDFANQVAHAVIARSPDPRRPVALLFEHEPLAIGALLGVLKAGRAYCALRPNQPPARLLETLADLDAELLLCSPATAAAAQALAAPLTVLDISTLSARPLESGLSVPLVTADTIGGVFYTSGSTGRPKGVMRSQAMLLHRAQQSTHLMEITPADRISLCFGISFGASIVDVFMALLNGASLHPYDAGGQGVVPLAAWLRDEGITILHLPVAFYRQFLDGLAPDDCFPTVRRITPSGKLYWSDLARSRPHFDPSVRLVSQFSSTETSLLAWMLVDPAETGTSSSVPVGRPVADKEVWLTGDDGQPVPWGAVGEVTVRSRYLSAGFWRQPAMTRERFTPAPNDPRMMTYRMGDLGRWLPDGTLEFLGRRDDQLKVRGYRVDLAEIEAGLYRTGQVAQAALTVREDGLGEKQVVAYVVVNQAELGLQGLRQKLLRLFPEYMVPARFVRLNPGEMPLTPNGKVDKQRLPPVGNERPDLETAFAPPQTDNERQMAALWEDVLHLKGIGRNDPFIDLGGNSLLAAQVATRARQRFRVELPLTVLLAAGTVAQLAIEAEQRLGAAADGPIEGIPARPDPGLPAPLSFAQEGVWFWQALEPDLPLYNQPKLLRLRGPLDVAALERSLSGLVQRHPALRTVVGLADGLPIQMALEPAAIDFRLERVDCRAATDPQAAAQAEARRLGRQTFDLAKDLLLRAALMAVAQNEHWLLLVTHHSAGDMWSSGLLFGDLAQFYQATRWGRAPDLPPLRTKPADFAAWQRAALTNARRQRLLDYWQAKLAGAPFLELPADFRRPAQRGYHGERLLLDLPLPDETRHALRHLQRTEKVTLYMLLLAVFKTLLRRYTGETDLVVGTPATHRPHPDLEGVMGMFANNLVLRTDLAGADTFRAALRRVRQTALGAYDHQDLPFQELMRGLQPARAWQRGSFFEVMFGLQNVDAAPPRLDGLMVERLPAGTHTARLEQTWLLFEEADGLRVDLEYSSECFRPETVRRMWTHFGNLLIAAVGEPDGPLAELPMLGSDELAQLRAWNSTHAPCPERCLHELFSAQAGRTPQAPALIKPDGTTLAYGEIETRSDRLARSLARLGLQPGERAGVYQSRSPETVITLLAVLKTGAAYVPLDPGYPAERLAYMCRDAGLKVVVTTSDLRPALGVLLQTANLAGIAVVAEDDLAEAPDQPLPAVHSPDRAMYVLYTSGSTGRPKGVVGLHRGMANRLAWMWQAFPFQAGEMLAHKTSLNFLDSAWEIFGPLLAGVPCLVIPDDILLDPAALVTTLAQWNVTRLVLVPSLLPALLDRFPDLGARLPRLRLWTCSGEALPADLALRFQRAAPDAKLLNLYGTTEVSADATWHVVTPNEAMTSVPIGRPIANMQAHVLDGHRQVVPVGVPGELYIGGVGLAQGYLGQPDETAQRFVTVRLEDESRLFRTGDLVRWQPDGQLEYLGRADDQVKLRGVRIELGEIEVLLRQEPAIRQAAVAVVEQGEERALAAYVVAHDAAPDEAIIIDRLAQHLAARLPKTMLPAAYTFLPALPLTSSGKVDRRRLPAPSYASGPANGLDAPADALVARLCAVWETVLPVAPIGPHDNFFALGGHSLLAFRLFAQIEKEFGQSLPVVVLFEAPTPAGLAAHLRPKPSAPNRSNPILVPIQPLGDRPPFFCVHGFGGGVMGYADLAARLGNDQPFYGLQAQGFATPDMPQATIPEMAELYLAQIRHTEPHGPYHLGGYDFGGLVAYEMARRLVEQGEQVGLLAVVECYAPRRARAGFSFRNRAHMANFLRNLPVWMSDLLSLPAGQAWQQVRGRLRSLVRRPARALAGRLEHALPPSLLSDDTRAVQPVEQRLVELQILAQAAYQPPTHLGRLDLFRVQRLSLFHAHDPFLGWGALAKGGVRLHVVDGRPNNLHQPPHVDSLAKALRAALEESPFVFSVPDAH